MNRKFPPGRRQIYSVIHNVCQIHDTSKHIFTEWNYSEIRSDSRLLIRHVNEHKTSRPKLACFGTGIFRGLMYDTGTYPLWNNRLDIRTRIGISRIDHVVEIVWRLVWLRKGACERFSAPHKLPQGHRKLLFLESVPSDTRGNFPIRNAIWVGNEIVFHGNHYCRKLNQHRFEWGPQAHTDATYRFANSK